MKVEIHDDVFNNVYLKYLQDVTPFQILYGGSSSGKSVFLAQRCVFDLLNGGRNYLVAREVAKSVRGSVSQEINKVITDWGVQSLFKINKTDGTITCHNGYQCVFTGLDDVEKLKSITPAKGVFTDLWIEEATEADEMSVGLLIKRQRGGSDDIPKRVTLSFNPILKTHWIYKNHFMGIKWADDQKEYHDENILILKTTYKDNKFLTKQDIYRLEHETDEYLYNVYTLGNWGVLGDVIFKNVHYVDLNQPGEYFLPEEQRTNRRNGLDFGFSSDPAAMPCMHLDKMRKRIYFFDELYERGLTNQELSNEIKKVLCTQYVMKDSDGKDVFMDKKDYLENKDKIDSKYHGAMPFDYRDSITCDSSEPKSIQELQIAGINAKGAKKGKDSVNFGVQWLQGYTIIIGLNCVNTYREFTTYHWKKNKDGESLRIPVDKDNHLIDGARYGLEDDMILQEVEVIENPFY
jgi:phage terminase large subunit